MTQTIKPNDWVYIPSISCEPLKALQEPNSILYAEANDERIYFNQQGKIDIADILPSVWLATPQNKTKIEEFYNITLHDIPLNKAENFEKLLNEFQVECEKYHFTGGNSQAKVDRMFRELTQMYLEELNK